MTIMQQVSVLNCVCTDVTVNHTSNSSFNSTFSSVYHLFCYCDMIRLHRMHDIQTIAIDDPVAWASVSLSVCHVGDCS